MTELPRGRVTLLFTDVEGSTGLVQTLGAAYPAALGELRNVLRGAVEQAGGLVLDTRGPADVAAEPFAARRDLRRQPVKALRDRLARRRVLAGREALPQLECSLAAQPVAGALANGIERRLGWLTISLEPSLHDQTSSPRSARTLAR